MSKPTSVQRMTVPKILARKGKDPIVCLTAYSAPVAKTIDRYADLILVGDSVAMVMHGMESTIGITLEHMIMHAQAVMRGSEKALVVVDMPFGSYEESPEVAYRNASRILIETGCTAVKLEGGVEMAKTIAFLTKRGIPVMAHIGLQPQAVQISGGFRAKGRCRDEWPIYEKDAKAVEKAGAFSVVLEGVAAPLATHLSSMVSIPTIGIGASNQCDGQILVTDDLLGLSPRIPSFVKQYAHLGVHLDEAVAAYAEDVRSRAFPGPEHTYAMKDA